MSRTLVVLAVVAVGALVVLRDDPAPGVADQSALSGLFSPGDIEDLTALNAEANAGEGFQSGTRAALVVGQQDDYEQGDGVTGL